MINIKTLNFETIDDLVFEMSENYEAIKEWDEFTGVCTIAKYDDARAIISGLAKLDYPLWSVRLESKEFEGYDKEFYVCLSDNGIYCGKLLHMLDGEYLPYHIEEDVVYVMDNCNSKVLKAIETDTIFEASIGECDCNIENCRRTKEDSSVIVNGKEIHDKNEKDKIIRDILIEYCDGMDKYNEKLKRFTELDCFIRDAFRFL